MKAKKEVKAKKGWAIINTCHCKDCDIKYGYGQIEAVYLGKVDTKSKQIPVLITPIKKVTKN